MLSRMLRRTLMVCTAVAATAVLGAAVSAPADDVLAARSVKSGPSLNQPPVYSGPSLNDPGIG
jgi:hypothetical protein